MVNYYENRCVCNKDLKILALGAAVVSRADYSTGAATGKARSPQSLLEHGA